MREWKSDHKRFPIRSGICDFCGAHGVVKQAHDLRRWLCRDFQPCLTNGYRKIRLKSGVESADEVFEASDLIGALADLYGN